MKKILDKKFGDKRVIVNILIGELRKVKKVQSDQDLIRFVDEIQRIKRKLAALKLLQEMEGTVVLTELRKKLPPLILMFYNQDYEAKKVGEGSNGEILGHFLEFMDGFRNQADHAVSAGGGSSARTAHVTGTLLAENQVESEEEECDYGTDTNAGKAAAKQNSKDSQGQQPRKEPLTSNKPCLACDDDGKITAKQVYHPMFECELWKALSFDERKAKLGTGCPRHLQRNHTLAECKQAAGLMKCRTCDDPDHCRQMCPTWVASTTSMLGYSSSTYAANGMPIMNPVMLMVQKVRTTAGEEIGSIIDGGSSDHYVTNEYAVENKLAGVPCKLKVRGIGNAIQLMDTHLYWVPVKDRQGVVEELPAFGLDKICGDPTKLDAQAYEVL